MFETIVFSFLMLGNVSYQQSEMFLVTGPYKEGCFVEREAPGSWYTNLHPQFGISSGLYKLYFGGGAEVYAREDENSTVYLFPYQLESTMEVGLKVGPIAIEWNHMCTHSLQSVSTVLGDRPVTYDASYTRISLKFEKEFTSAEIPMPWSK